MFALSLVPLTMAIGLAVDYSDYVASRSQLNLAADAAAMHAVRVASNAYKSGGGTITTAAATAAGVQAGQQWFAAQLGNWGSATVAANNIQVTVNYSTAPSSFTSAVTYNATVPTRFGGIFKVPTWPVGGRASAVITDSYVEVVMMLDNSPSMLLGATLGDIASLEAATPCSAQAASAGQDMANYAWVYPGSYGYLTSGSTSVPTPPPATTVGNCDPNYTGAAQACPYVPAVPARSISPTTGLCTNGGGATVNYNNWRSQANNVPQAPCAFACHNTLTTAYIANATNPNLSGTYTNDYFGLARSLGVTLRLDVVQAAAANVVATLAASGSPNQFSVGVYQFASALQQVYPPTASLIGNNAQSAEAGTDLVTAQTTLAALKNAPSYTPIALGLTNFPASAAALGALVTAGGTGLAPATPIKNLFIVTDGLGDVGSAAGPRTIGAVTSAASETVCQPFKDKGFNVYVLYTPYLPVPNAYYFNNVKQSVEPTSNSAVLQALQACASAPANFFQASDPTAINAAMQTMLKSALSSPGRIAY